jgi:tetratricopeptide (TPR) repeat protein
MENSAPDLTVQNMQTAMTTTISGSLLVSLAVLAMSPSANGAAEGPGATATSAPAILTPAVPARPGRPHSPSYDPHGKLDPETQIQIALQHKLEGRPQEALTTLGLAIVNSPDNARLYAVRGSLLLEQGRITPALSDLEKAVKLDPNDAEALTNRAQAYRRFGRMDQALADLDRAIEVEPNLIAARFNRSAMRYGKRDFRGALEDLDHCIAIDPHLPGPYFNRAVVSDALGDRQSARADLKRFLQIEENEDFREQAQEVLDLWRNPAKEKARADEVQPSPHR